MVWLRKNLPDGWRLAGPEMRSGTTEKAWNTGRDLPVEQLRLVGHNWSNAWYATYALPS